MDHDGLHSVHGENDAPAGMPAGAIDYESPSFAHHSIRARDVVWIMVKLAVTMLVMGAVFFGCALLFLRDLQAR